MDLTVAPARVGRNDIHLYFFDEAGQSLVPIDAVEITVIDEADHMADLGFLPGVTRILAATPAGGQRLLFSATLDNGVDKLVKRFLRNPVSHRIVATREPGPSCRPSATAPATLMPDDRPRQSPSSASRRRTHSSPSSSEMRNCVSIGAPSRLAVIRPCPIPSATELPSAFSSPQA